MIKLFTTAWMMLQRGTLFPAGGAPPVDDWILATGFWRDIGVWDDTAVWID